MPSHAIIGNASGKTSLAFTPFYAALGKLFITGGRLGLDAWDTAKLLLGDENDYVVSKPSQLGRIHVGTQFSNTTHLEETSIGEIGNRVLQLIHASVYDPTFDFFPTTFSILGKISSTRQLQLAQTKTSLIDTFYTRIVSPHSTFQASSGASFNLKIDVSDTSILNSVAIVGFENILLDTLKSLDYRIDVPYQFIGEETIYAIAFDNQGRFGIDSLICQVHPNSSLLSIDLKPDSVSLLQTDLSLLFRVNGLYSDNVIRDISSDSRLQFFSEDTSVALVSSTGHLTPVRSGRLHVWVRIESLSDTSWAIIEASPITSISSGHNDMNPPEFSLSQNYPNPFNPETNITFSLPKRTFVVVRVFNVLGHEVKSLAESQLSAGRHSISWNGRNNHGQLVSSGLYFYRIQAGEFSTTKKMLVIR